MPPGRQALDTRILDVMGRVPRHLFVPEEVREKAYANRPLPIGYAPSHLLAWCRLDELNTNSCRALLDKFQNLGSAP
jgi:protein-L-isoaspartate O-methyltransferase